MLMPIVSMNKMAMNESVATTCCYRQVASNPTALYWDVLHGGWIGNGYGTTHTWKDGFSAYENTSWLSKSFGRDLKGDTANILSLFAGSTLNYGTAGGTEAAKWYVNDYVVGQSLDTSIYNASNGTVSYANGSACDHTVATCAYKNYSYGYLTNKHFEATSAHADITKWAEPHDPKQYLS